MFFVPRAQPEVRNTSRFMVECTNVTFYSDGLIKTRFGPAGRKGIFFVPEVRKAALLHMHMRSREQKVQSAYIGAFVGGGNFTLATG